MRPHMIGTWALSLLVAVGWLGMADGGGPEGTMGQLALSWAPGRPRGARCRAETRRRVHDRRRGVRARATRVPRRLGSWMTACHGHPNGGTRAPGSPCSCVAMS
jgi:hypothetical protein